MSAVVGGVWRSVVSCRRRVDRYDADPAAVASAPAINRVAGPVLLEGVRQLSKGARPCQPNAEARAKRKPTRVQWTTLGDQNGLDRH